MFDRLSISTMAQAMAAHAAQRMNVISENVANADTPKYRARDITAFATLYDDGATMRATRSGHLSQSPERADYVLAQGEAAPNGNNVSLEMEMVKTAEARQSHEMALAIYQATSSVVRTSLGRRG